MEELKLLGMQSSLEASRLQMALQVVAGDKWVYVYAALVQECSACWDVALRDG